MEIEEAYEKMGSREIYEEWRSRSVTLGRYVRITSISGDLVGVVEDLAEDGALLLKTEDGLPASAGRRLHTSASPGGNMRVEKGSRHRQGYSEVHPGGVPVVSACGVRRASSGRE